MKNGLWVVVVVVVVAVWGWVGARRAVPPQVPSVSPSPRLGSGGGLELGFGDIDGRVMVEVDDKRLMFTPRTWPAFSAFVRRAETMADSQTPSAVTGRSDGFFQDRGRSGRVGINVEYARDFLQFVWNDPDAKENRLVQVVRKDWPDLNRRLADIDRLAATHPAPPFRM
ncbi:MAG TPA: hypothetical protein VGO93_30445 [Candidatus Xenobia bacterium]